MKKLLKYLRIVRLLEREMSNAFHMNYWGRAYNLCDRLDRVKGRPPQRRLAAYQKFKRGFAADLNWKGDWQFHPYTLS